MLESVYQKCRAHRLSKCGLNIVVEYPIPVVFEDVRLECGYRADIIVENVVEIKSVDAFNDIHNAQVLTHLK